MRKLLIVILVLLSSSISIAQSITQPAAKKFELNVSGQACSGFVLNGFTSTDILLASIGFINPPTGTSFTLTTTTGLTPASGFTFSEKTIKVKITQQKNQKYSISCAKGNATKKVIGTKPKCPKGFKIKVWEKFFFLY